MTSLNEFQKLIVEQAKRKGWNNGDDWLFAKLLEEFIELWMASVFLKKSQREIASEGSDMIVLIAQIIQKFAPNVSMDFSLQEKIDDNEASKKKTLVGTDIVKK